MTCNAGHNHEALKLTAWTTLEYIGHQIIEADDEGPAEALELRNCVCGSTLAKLVEAPSVDAES